MANPLPVPPAVALSNTPVPAPTPVSSPPNLTVVPTTSPEPRPLDLLDLYKSQKRECWMCQKAATDLEAGKTLDEEYAWHFVTCVLSWAHLNPAPAEG